MRCSARLIAVGLPSLLPSLYLLPCSFWHAGPWSAPTSPPLLPLPSVAASLSCSFWNTQPLLEHMVCSNEPGYYEGQFSCLLTCCIHGYVLHSRLRVAFKEGGAWG